MTGAKAVICRDSRDQLALALRRYASGRITNDDLDDVQANEMDRGSVAIKEASWFLYDDLWTYKAKGGAALSNKQKKDIARWIVFLHSDNEYLWPKPTLPILDTILNLFTFGLWNVNPNYSKIVEDQDIAVWPFLRAADFKTACQNPRYFVGDLAR